MSSKNANVLSFVCLIISLGVLCLTVFDRQQSQHTNEITAIKTNPRINDHTPDNVQQLQQEINQLRNVLGDTHQMLAQLQNQQKKLTQQMVNKNDLSTEEEASSNEQASITSPGEQPINNEAVRRREQHINYLDDKLYDEEVDMQWSSSTSDQIFDTLTTLPTVEADSSFVECRSTLCIVELTVGEADAEEFLMSFNAQMAESTNQMRSFASNRGDGKLAIQMYLAKAGTHLPEFNPNQITP